MSTKRNGCLAYLAEYYSDWAKPYETSHVVRSHYGYSWVLTEQGWQLKCDSSGDVITKSDLETYRNTAQVARPMRHTKIPNIDGLFWYYSEVGEARPVLINTAKFGTGKFKCFESGVQDWLRSGEYLVGPQAPLV